MASARPSDMYKGGGALNGVDGTVVALRFTDEFFGKPFEPGKIKTTEGKSIDKPHTLNVDISIQLDGADEAVTRTLKAAGNYDAWVVSEDGSSVSHTEDPERTLPQGTAWGKLVTSMVESGLPEDEFPTDEISYQFIVGKRFRFIQKVDEERTKKYGQKENRKSGKSFDRTDLLVDVYYADAPAVQPAKTAAQFKTAVKPTGKSTSATRTNGSGKAAASPVQALAESTLIDILKKQKENEIAKSKLSMAVLRALGKHDDREAVRNLVFTDEFLNLQNGWVYDEATETVALA